MFDKKMSHKKGDAANCGHKKGHGHGNGHGKGQGKACK